MKLKINVKYFIYNIQNALSKETELFTKQVFSFSVIHTKGSFKSRCYQHIQSFRSEIKKESTRLSRFIHKIKNENIDWNNIIKWEIIQHTNQKRPGSIYSLCRETRNCIYRKQ